MHTEKAIQTLFIPSFSTMTSINCIQEKDSPSVFNSTNEKIMTILEAFKVFYPNLDDSKSISKY